MSFIKTVIMITMLILPNGQFYSITREMKPTPIIYTTDLFHPRDDADDIYDIAALYAMPDIDIKGIVLEQGIKQKERPGSDVVNQLNTLTERNVPYSIGLSEKLSTITDDGLSQPTEFQGGVNMILNTLAESSDKVSIVSVGSLRDVAAAYNRNPQLFRDKLDRLLIFAGEANADFVEYNVDLDPNAYVSIMRSGLNIYWVPCFDGGLWSNNGKASFWRVEKQEDLLKDINPKLMQFFVYNLEKRTGDPISYLSTPTLLEDQIKVFNDHRNLWCTVIFQSLTGLYNRNLFDFKPVNVSITNDGKPLYNQPDSKPMMQFNVVDKESYSKEMTKKTNGILLQFSA